MLRYFLALYAFALIAIVSVLGFRGDISQKEPLEIFPDMDRQMRFKPQASTDFFEDGRQDRPGVAGTVATTPQHLEVYAPYETFIEDDYYATGNKGDAFGSGYPESVTFDAEFLELGHEKYDIFCSRCHGYSGDGNGITKARGMAATPSYHSDLYRNMPEGEIYNTITHGKNTMKGYGSKLRVEERWAIVAYLRALQRAANATVEDVPQQNLKELGL